MKLSRRAKRMEMHHRRKKRGSELNLVSLMDIFTILLFFLLINQAEVQNLPSSSTIKLPESISENKPRETTTIVVTATDIIVAGEPVMRVADAIASTADSLQPVKAALRDLANRNVLTQEPNPDAAGAPPEKEVTVMGDRALPYKLLKKIIVSCTEAAYNHISLAVVQKESTTEK